MYSSIFNCNKVQKSRLETLADNSFKPSQLTIDSQYLEYKAEHMNTKQVTICTHSFRLGI